MKKQAFFCLAAAALLLAGCKTLEQETQRIPWARQQAYLKRAQDPRVFGLAIYDTPGGPQIRGGGRLHPQRAEALPMLAVDPVRPLVLHTGSLGDEWPVLLDCTATATWMEFEFARECEARPVSEGKASLMIPSGDEIPVTLSCPSALRLGQMFIEHPLVYVRMATGSLGPLNREVSEGPVHAVVGWDLLKKFDQIQFLYSIAQVVLTTTDEYEANPEQLIATLPILKRAGVCAVRGEVDGEARPVLIDPAGDFEVATEAGAAVSTLKLGEALTFLNPETAVSPGGVRIGARLLEKYHIVICPTAGLVHFEKAPVLTEE